jgi:hypothetical protein
MTVKLIGGGVLSATLSEAEEAGCRSPFEQEASKARVMKKPDILTIVG